MAGKHYCKNNRLQTCVFFHYYFRNNSMNRTRIAISIIAVIITGKVSFKVGEQGVGSEWFITMAMFLASYLPDILVEEESKVLRTIRILQMILATPLSLVSVLGVFDVFVIRIIDRVAVLKTTSDFILSDKSLGSLVYWWIPILVLEVCIIVRYVVTPSSIHIAMNQDGYQPNKRV